MPTWKPAQPNDAANRGKWWEIFNDPELNALEEQVSITNQNVLAAEAQYRAARAAIRVVRSNLFPIATVAPSIIYSRSKALGGTATSASTRTTYDLPGDASYEPDLWGRIRRSVNASVAGAQASAADLANARLVYQDELAEDYFQLHGEDRVQALLERTVKSYQDYLQLTQDRYNAGVASGGDVAQAQTQLKTAQAQLIDVGISRAQNEHAIALLTGRPPAAVSIPPSTTRLPPPNIPAGLPSELLERRADVAAAERRMAEINEQIGIAKAAFFPTLLLTASGGLDNTRISQWITWPSRFWSVGPQLAEVVFDAGARRAQVVQAQAQYDATIASYRELVLDTFQQVEDRLAELRVLAQEAQAVDDAVRAAQDSLAIATAQYKAGTTSYLQVITTQTIALQNEVAAETILTRRMITAVSLIRSLGGGWDVSTLPTAQTLVSTK